MKVRRTIGTGAAMLVVLALAACGGSSSSGGNGSGKTIKVQLTEYKISPTPDTAPAGKVTFDVKNVGSIEHEVVIVKASDPSALPTKPDGTVDEDTIPEGQTVGEIAGLKPGKSEAKTFDLKAGTYVMFCNEEKPVGHFAQGMDTTFVVN